MSRDKLFHNRYFSDNRFVVSNIGCAVFVLEAYIVWIVYGDHHFYSDVHFCDQEMKVFEANRVCCDCGLFRPEDGERQGLAQSKDSSDSDSNYIEPSYKPFGDTSDNDADYQYHNEPEENSINDVQMESSGFLCNYVDHINSEVEVFYKQIMKVDNQVDKLSRKIKKLKDASELSKSITNSFSQKVVRKRMEKMIRDVGENARNVKAELEGIKRDNLMNRKKPGCNQGTGLDRLRMNMTNRLAKKFKDIVKEFMILREKIQDEYREVVRRRFITVIGSMPDEETVDYLVETGTGEQIYQKAIQGHPQVLDALKDIEERHDAIKEIQKNLLDLHQIYLDMAVLVEAQGEMLDNIECQCDHALEEWQECFNQIAFAHEDGQVTILGRGLFRLWMVTFEGQTSNG
ncbi:syntaxin-132-like [Ziziphus jujuba]|uniref:Syntaxin-132-like n=1 Tax=Ziziphus jujuba TaxID=326968 RepID=A0ABM3IHH8_ZIZJJ|nr:syntaxin-132-like [Ziziphus jujuba]